MNLHTIGGIASLICAATYLFGFAFLVTILAPLGYGTADIDASAVVAFIDANPSLLILWNSVIYIVNALALAVLVVALHDWQKARAPAWAALVRALGGIWAALVLGAGMIGNVAVERVAHLSATAPDRAIQLWETLHSVELGLGGGNEIAGGVWIVLVSIAGFAGHSLSKLTVGLGVISGASGLITLVPVFGDVAGAMFGLGAIVWFIFVGLALLQSNRQGVRHP